MKNPFTSNIYSEQINQTSKPIRVIESQITNSIAIKSNSQQISIKFKRKEKFKDEHNKLKRGTIDIPMMLDPAEPIVMEEEKELRDG